MRDREMRVWIWLLAIGFLSLFGVSCSSQVSANGPVKHQMVYGRTALYRNGVAYAPSRAPEAVKRAIRAANRLQSKPYRWGGGHARMNDGGYDCSGSVSYVLREAGLMKGVGTSRSFLKYGEKGYGKWITLYVKKGHVFMVIAGLRLDTGGHLHNGETGPRWKPESRSARGFYVRHPDGL